LIEYKRPDLVETIFGKELKEKVDEILKIQDAFEWREYLS
jgi:hypothetical protein